MGGDIALLIVLLIIVAAKTTAREYSPRTLY